MKMIDTQAVKQELRNAQDELRNAQDTILRALALVRFDSEQEEKAEEADAESIGTAACQRFRKRKHLAIELENLSRIGPNDSAGKVPDWRLLCEALKDADSLETQQSTAAEDDDPARLAKINLILSKNGSRNKQGRLKGLSTDERNAARAGASVVIRNPGGWFGDFEVVVCRNPKEFPDSFVIRDLTIEEGQILNLLMGSKP